VHRSARRIRFVALSVAVAVIASIGDHGLSLVPGDRLGPYEVLAPFGAGMPPSPIMPEIQPARRPNRKRLLRAVRRKEATWAHP